METPALRLLVNGEARETRAATVMQLLEELGLHERRVAVLVDGAIVRRAEFANHRLEGASAVEIISLIGGG